MIMIDDTTAIVFDTDDLRDAVSTDNGVEYVYLGANIELAYGITIYPNKPSLVIDGTHEDTRHTFTDIAGISYANTLGIRAQSEIELTIKNIDLLGENYYGIPFVSEGPNTDNVTVIYSNVTYTGRQMIFHQRGLTRFLDCDITITGSPSGYVQEVGEVCKVEIGGRTTIRKINTEHAVFWFYGNSTRRPYLKILTDAEVTINTANYFMFEYSPPDYIIEPNANFTLNTNSGISLDSSHTVASFFVGENASFRYTQAAIGNDTIYLDGALTVSEDANFYMQADFSNTNRLIRFTGSSGSLHLNNPKSFALYNGGSSSSATTFYFTSTIPITLSGGQVNYWRSAMEFPEAGTFEDEPLHKWKRPSWDRFTLSGTAGRAQTDITYNDFTEEELTELPPLVDLQLHSARVFSVGNIPLTIYSTVITRHVTGLTEPYANTKIVLMPSYYEDPQTVVADEDGLFAITPGSSVPFSDYVEVFANTPFLIVSAIKEVLEADVLYIASAPLQISFPVKPMEGFTDKILPRDSENTDSTVVVMDTRDPKTPWVLWANITGPLKTEDDDILDDAVVFAVEDGSFKTLGAELVSVRLDGPDNNRDDVTVTWPENRGVLVRVTVPIRSGKKYTTALGWAVYPEGEQPEGGY